MLRQMRGKGRKLSPSLRSAASLQHQIIILHTLYVYFDLRWACIPPSSKRSVPTNRLPDWYFGVDYVEINAREKSKQILLNHCRKKYSFPCLGASNFDQERQKSGFQRTCNAHIGPNDIENSSSSDWRRLCIGFLSDLVGNLAVYIVAPHFGDHPRYEEQAHGRLPKWPLSCLNCTPYQKMTPEIQF